MIVIGPIILGQHKHNYSSAKEFYELLENVYITIKRKQVVSVVYPKKLLIFSTRSRIFLPTGPGGHAFLCETAKMGRLPCREGVPRGDARHVRVAVVFFTRQSVRVDEDVARPVPG